MSIGFRIFLLTLLGFGAVWIYRFRAPELTILLSPTRPLLADPIDAPQAEDERAWGRLEPRARTGWERLASTDWDLESWAPERLEAGETPWNDDAEPAPEPEYERFEHDPDLVAGAFEESAEGLPQTADETAPLAPGSFEPVDGRGVVDSFDTVESGGAAPRPASAGPTELEYVVQKGDNLWKVAEKLLGKGHRYGEIKKLNSLSSDTLVPGTRLRVRVPENRASEENLKSRPAADDKSVEASSGLEENSLALKTHKVKARETLSEIASRYLPGVSGAVQALLDANRETVPSPDEILEGQILVIPSRR